jgi:HPt (histidine-containing phosphotransfer) domain-containing protein
MNEQLVELLPLFLEESRVRLARLEELLPLLPADRQAADEARRQLHTLKGCCRLLELEEMAQLCQRGEEHLASAAGGQEARLAAILEGFGIRLEAVAGHWHLQRDASTSG